MGATDLLPEVSILIAAEKPGSRLSCYYSFPVGASLGSSVCSHWGTTPTARTFLTHQHDIHESSAHVEIPPCALLDEGCVAAVQVTSVQSICVGLLADKQKWV